MFEVLHIDFRKPLLVNIGNTHHISSQNYPPNFSDKISYFLVSSKFFRFQSDYIICFILDYGEMKLPTRSEREQQREKRWKFL